MQDEPTSPAQKRERTHAKLLTWDERQVLTHLLRAADGQLTIVLQLWVASSDEQCRVVLNTSLPDERVQAAFEDMDDRIICDLLEILGVPKLIAEIGASG